MSDDKIHLVTDFQVFAKPPKPTYWDYVKFYAFNLYRKPLVYKRQKELVNLFNSVKTDLDERILPTLVSNKCQQCKKAYGYLHNQVFMSQLKSVLLALSKDYDHQHWPIFESFLKSKETLFSKSEDLSRWINNL